VQQRNNARHIGRHRAPTAPRATYAALVTTAVVGAGAAALTVGSALPAADTLRTSSALDVAGADLPDSAVAAITTSGNQSHSGTSRASRAQRRTGVSDPRALPEWIKPAVGPLSSGFAARWGTFHYGDDIAAAYGSTVRAASAGTIIRAGWYGGYGMVVIIDHGNGITTRYGHNSSLLVSVGEKVDVGTPIAHVGSTGDSTGPHCHFEVRENDVPVDPTPWMLEHGVDLGHVDTGL
jgi:murein DD-endopeptidase MepM/ murein hydrolase activator NlpD